MSGASAVMTEYVRKCLGKPFGKPIFSADCDALNLPFQLGLLELLDAPPQFAFVVTGMEIMAFSGRRRLKRALRKREAGHIVRLADG